MKRPLLFLTGLVALGGALVYLAWPYLDFDAPPPASGASMAISAPRLTPRATPRATPTGRPGTDFTGEWIGVLSGDDNSSAPVTLDLVQTGREVEGTITAGPGLFLDGGRCGEAEVPSGEQSAAGQVDRRDPNKLTAEAQVEVSGLNITIKLTGLLAPGGRTLAADALIDLPRLCGRDPVVAGTFVRQ